MSSSPIALRLAGVRERIAAAAERVGRDPAEVTLVAVSKGFDVASIRQALATGQRDLGENRVQEALAKYKEVGSLLPGVARWHFIGRLQRNKAKYLVGWVHCIHSVDRLELASEIDRRAQDLDGAGGGAGVEVLIEVNVSGEEAKGGVEPSALPPMLEAVAALPSLRVAGLMTMAPRVSLPDEARPYFRRLAGLRDEASRRYPELHLQHLSMGMSQDYEVAVEEGSTIVRIGEAIFGPRSGGPRDGGPRKEVPI
ncbi:MAG TPA: YggS family pyridoxal phosphate-dependent enzyme [Actinomycetota bacterium]|nr:YggS family pyridoxal phosphate-dependent enzyme [Actinomycetota bacterium]